MSAPMTMNRVIHGAVRRDLRRLADALQASEPGDRSRAADLERAFTNLREQLTHHHHGEDEHIWPMLSSVGADADLLAAMESEHEAMAAALRETSGAMAAYSASDSTADAAAAHASVVRTTEVVERHLRHEENELEPVLTPHLESAQWKAVEKKLSRQSPRIAGTFFAWVTDGMGAQERAFFRATIPRPVVYLLSRTFGRRYHREIAPVWRR